MENGEPKILFEAHHFSKFTGGKFDKTYLNISSPVWDKRLYAGGIAEHKRLQQAVALDRDSALRSTSWGKFQIMGFNWKACGYENLREFINDMYSGEAGQLRAFVGMLKAMRLVDALRNHDWKTFAKGYNGPRYQQNNYDKRLQLSYEQFKGSA